MAAGKTSVARDGEQRRDCDCQRPIALHKVWFRHPITIGTQVYPWVVCGENGLSAVLVGSGVHVTTLTPSTTTYVPLSNVLQATLRGV